MPCVSDLIWFVIPSELAHILSRLEFINNSGVPVVMEQNMRNKSHRITKSAYDMVDIKTLSSVSYMKCIKKYSGSQEKHMMNAICQSMISGCISKEGEYNKAYARRREKSALHLFASPANGRNRNIDQSTVRYVGSAPGVDSSMMINMFKRTSRRRSQHNQT